MKIIRAKDYYDMSRKAANIISAQVIMKPNCVLGLATGGTPVGAYAQLVDWYNKGDIDFSEVTTVNLDEYRGLPKEHPESYWSFIVLHVVLQLDLLSDGDAVVGDRGSAVGALEGDVAALGAHGGGHGIGEGVDALGELGTGIGAEHDVLSHWWLPFESAPRLAESCFARQTIT